MKWSELPQEYRDLVESPELGYDFNSDNIAEKFKWSKSNEGSQFWQKCCDAISISDLPPIPNEKSYIQYLLDQIKEKDNVIDQLKAKNNTIYLDIQKKFFERIAELEKYLNEANNKVQSKVNELNSQVNINIEICEQRDKLKEELKEASVYIEKYTIDIENLKVSNDRLKAELRVENECIDPIFEPEFYMVFVDGMSSATLKYNTLEDAIREANRLATNNERVVHILAHVESYQREIIIKQVN